LSLLQYKWWRQVSYYWFFFLHMWNHVTLQEFWSHVFRYTCAFLMKFPVLTCLKIFVSNTLFTSSLKFLNISTFFVFDLKYNINRLYISTVTWSFKNKKKIRKLQNIIRKLRKFFEVFLFLFYFWNFKWLWYQHAHLPSADRLARGFFTPQNRPCTFKIVGTFYMQGYKVKEKTAIVPPVSKLSGHPVIYRTKY
jgi:hypothetical protein